MRAELVQKRTTVVIVIALFVVRLVHAAAMAADLPATQSSTQPGVQYTANGSIKAVISRETTYLTEPVLADGTIDFLKAINDKASAGVTKENNAAVVLFEVFGPKVVGEQIRAEFFRLLDLNLPEMGNYPIPPDRDVYGEMANSRDNGDVPLAAVTWLQDYKPELDQLAEASKIPRFYAPLISEHGSLPVADIGLGQIRLTVNALACRAILRARDGDLDGASADVLTVFRWGKLAGQEPAMFGGLMNWACDGAGARVTQSIAHSEKMTAIQARRLLAEIDQLPGSAGMRDVAESERLLLLGTAAELQRRGTAEPIKDLLEVMQAFGDSEGPALNPQKLALVVDYIALTKSLNRPWDQIDVAMARANRAERMKAMDGINTEIQKIAVRSAPLKRKAGWERLTALPAEQQRKQLTPLLADFLVGMNVPAVGAAARAQDRSQMQVALARIALALAAYHAEHKEYPPDLTALAPGYLKEIPQDLFTDQPLHYQRTGNGYLLYSVGPDMKDDGGAEKTDDIVVKTS